MENKTFATPESFIKYQEDFFNSLVELTKKKNHDYAGAANDPFTNFMLVERLGVTEAEKGILVRMVDKLSRINNFLEQGVLEVSDESITDTLKDLANYSALLANLIYHKKKQDREDKIIKPPYPIQKSNPQRFSEQSEY